jgi:hypothetical protein
MITTEEGTPNLIAWYAFDTDREEEPKNAGEGERL